MNSSRHLLCLYPWLKLGGADKFNLDMLGQLRRRGWRATVVTTLPATHSWRAAFEPVCDQIIDIATTPPAEHPARLVQIIEVSRPDCALISHSSLGYAALPYLRAHYPELPFADYCHIEEPYWRDGGYPRMSLAQAAGLDLQIVSSDHLKAWMTERGGEPARIEVCSTNIDTADWNPARYDRARLRAEIGLPSDAHVVLYAARLERQKQPMLAARVIRAAIAGSARLHVLIAGDGLFGPYLQSYVRRHGLEGRARLLGAVSGERMRELLAISDVFFLPSLHEGISLAIYEAMAMGVAPVSANVGGQAELLTPECGVLIARVRSRT